jgi:predicted alpha/beta superfamily hydrolase
VKFPIIHLNGSSVDTLAADYAAALEALRAAQTALSNTAPNKRDYYVLADGDAVFDAARSEHLTRVEALQRVALDVGMLLENVLDQKAARRARGGR